MRPLTRDEARAALQKGQGRIALHLREYGADTIREDLLDACQRSLAYDAQVEGTRADWLLSLIDAAGDVDFYREGILDAIPTAAEFWDLAQLLDLTLRFAQRGCPQARAALYATFGLQRFNEDWLGGHEIGVLDGVAGLLHVTKVIGARVRAEPGYWVDDDLLRTTSERCGLEPVLAALHDRAGESENVRAYLDGIAASRNRRKAAASPLPRTERGVDEILADIEAASEVHRILFVNFGRRAGEQDLERVFAVLLRESRRDQLLRCLWVFRRRALPQPDARLLALTESGDHELAVAATAALAESQDPRIRDTGLAILRSSPDAITRGAIALFKRNYAPGDHAAIETALFVPEDPDAVHGIGFDLLDVAEAQPDPKLAGCLEWVYEHTPCSHCRRDALKRLLERGRATAHLLEEAAWDCHEETRKLAGDVPAHGR